MSYDISIVKRNKEVYDDNYTYNVGDMFRTAIGGNGLYELKDKSIKEVIMLLDKAIKHMKENPDIYKAMNPTNKWGNYEGALLVLENLHFNCLKYKRSMTARIEIT